MFDSTNTLFDTPRHDPGEMGKLMWLDKSLIHIDDGEKGYQRQQSQARIDRMCADFQWSWFGVVIVSHRNGKYYAIDAGHRVTVAKKLHWIKKVPCIVFYGKTRRDEAKDFLGINTGVKPRPLAIYKARLVERDELTLAVEATLRRHGFGIGRGDPVNRFVCPNDLRLLQEGGQLDEVLGFIAEVWQDDATRTKSPVVDGVARFLRRMRVQHQQIPTREIVQKFKHSSVMSLYQKAKGRAEINGTSVKDAFCTAMCEHWNKGRRTQRLSLMAQS